MIANTEYTVLSPSSNDESNLWLPPRRMRHYEIAKAATGAIAMAILLWLTFQWSDIMQWIGVSLILITAWVTIGSIIMDFRHARGRQVGIEDAVLRITDGQHQTALAINDVARAQWRDDNEHETGLTFYDAEGRSMAHLNTHFLADESEARTFIGWLRRKTNATLNVDWPDRT